MTTQSNISGNLIATISDHLSRFFIASDIFSNSNFILKEIGPSLTKKHMSWPTTNL